MKVSVIKYMNDEVKGKIIIKQIIREKTKKQKAYDYRDTENKVLNKLRKMKPYLIISMEVEEIKECEE